jgi:hypothetical protein
MENQLTLHRAVHLTSHRTVQLTLYRARANRANEAHARKPPACRQRPSRRVGSTPPSGFNTGRPPAPLGQKPPPVTSAPLVYPQSTSVIRAHERRRFLACRRKPSRAKEQPFLDLTPSNHQNIAAGSPPPVTSGFLVYRQRVASEPHWCHPPTGSSQASHQNSPVCHRSFSSLHQPTEAKASSKKLLP